MIRPSEARPIQAPDLPARLIDESSRCVRCGLCQPHCPTYALDRNEAESPRGRITLARALALGQLDSHDASASLALDHCLGCRRCEAACPAGVAFDQLLVDARTQVREQRRPPWRQRWLERAIVLRWPLDLAWPVLRGLRRLLPRRAIKRPALLPNAAPASAGWHTATSPSRGRLALFTGCVARGLDAQVHRAAIRVLNRLGWDVWISASSECCGALHRHAGDADSAARLAASTRQALPGCDAVLIAASGCHADLRIALRDTATPVHELTAFIAADRQLDRLSLRTGSSRVIVQIPCTQSTAVGQPEAARRLLSRITGLHIDALADRGCCGAAGSHMLLFPERAAALRDTVLSGADLRSGDILCSSNIGCRLHLAQAPQLAAIDTRHPIEIFAEHLT